MSDHSEYHTALEAAINQSLAKYEIVCDVKRSGYYQATDSRITQPVIIASCKGRKDIVMSLTHPTARENGDPLLASEIKGYEVRAVDTDGLCSVPVFKSVVPSSAEDEADNYAGCK